MTQEYTIPTLYCANHPNRETMLRCNNCDKPICSQCAVLTPTGYRCKECLRGQQKVFDTAGWWDYPLAIVIALVLSYLGSLIAARFGFFTIFIAPLAGIAIAEVVRWVIRKRRARLLFQLTAGAALVGALPGILLPLLAVLLNSGQVGGFGLFGLLWQGVYAFLVASTVYTRLSGIQMRR